LTALPCACGGRGGFPTASELPGDERRPDGIAVDLSSDPPPWRDRAESGDHIVTLRTPLSSGAALETVRSFFDALVNEDASALDKLAVSNAVVEDTRARRAPPGGPSAAATHTLTSLWRERFRKHEFQGLSGGLLFREADITTYRKQQLDALPIAVRYLGPARDAVEPTDLVLHVPIVTHSVKNERLLGDHMFFWLRRDEERFVIYRMAEDLPF
jgi:hypothetical protein